MRIIKITTALLTVLIFVGILFANGIAEARRGGGGVAVVAEEPVLVAEAEERVSPGQEWQVVAVFQPAGPVEPQGPALPGSITGRGLQTEWRFRDGQAVIVWQVETGWRTGIVKRGNRL